MAKVTRRDIIEELIEAISKAQQERPGTADGEVNVFALPVTVTSGLLTRAVKEIERLRRSAGAVSEGESFEEIRRLARAGAPLVDIERRLHNTDVSGVITDSPPLKIHPDGTMWIGGKQVVGAVPDKPSDSE